MTLCNRKPYLFNFSVEPERAMKNSMWRLTVTSQTQQAMSGGPRRIPQIQKSKQNATMTQIQQTTRFSIIHGVVGREH